MDTSWGGGLPLGCGCGGSGSRNTTFKLCGGKEMEKNRYSDVCSSRSRSNNDDGRMTHRFSCLGVKKDQNKAVGELLVQNSLKYTMDIIKSSGLIIVMFCGVCSTSLSQ